MIGIVPIKRDISVAFLEEERCLVCFSMDFDVVEENRDSVSEEEIIENTGLYLAREAGVPIRRVVDYWMFEYDTEQFLCNESNGLFQLKLDCLPISNVIVPTTLNIAEHLVDIVESSLKSVKFDEYEYIIRNIPLTSIDIKIRKHEIPDFDKMIQLDQSFEVTNCVVKVTPNSQNSIEIQHDFEIKLTADTNIICFYYPRELSLKKIGIFCSDSDEFDYLRYELGEVYIKKMVFCGAHLNTMRRAGETIVFRVVIQCYFEFPGDVQITTINNNEVTVMVEKIDHFSPNFYGIKSEIIDYQMTLIIDSEIDGNVESSLKPLRKEEFIDEDGIERFRSVFSSASQNVSSVLFKFPSHSTL